MELRRNFSQVAQHATTKAPAGCFCGVPLPPKCQTWNAHPARDTTFRLSWVDHCGASQECLWLLQDALTHANTSRTSPRVELEETGSQKNSSQSLFGFVRIPLVSVEPLLQLSDEAAAALGCGDCYKDCVLQPIPPPPTTGLPMSKSQVLSKKQLFGGARNILSARVLCVFPRRLSTTLPLQL